MYRWQRFGGCVLILLCMLGCALGGARPTPLPTAEATSEAAPPSTATATVTLPAPPPTPTAPPPTATAPPPATLPPPPPTPTPSPIVQAIHLTTPAEGSAVGNPVRVEGTVARMPFEATLVVQIYDTQGRQVAITPIQVAGEYGSSGTFAADVFYGGVPGPGRIEVLEFSARDGSVVARAATRVTLGSGLGVIESPAPLAEVTLPLQVWARLGTSGEAVTLILEWQDGTEMLSTWHLLPGLDGRGLLAMTAGWELDSRTHPPTQAALLKIYRADGALAAAQPLRVLHPDDPGTMGVDVYWVVGETLKPQRVRVPRTLGIGRAALETLLWGPLAGQSAGFTTALPLPADVLAYPQRAPDWGERVRLNNLTIVNGLAHADFSGELLAYPGGALHTTLILGQIEQTLLQFSTVNEVLITVEGQRDRLQP